MFFKVIKVPNSWKPLLPGTKKFNGISPNLVDQNSILMIGADDSKLYVVEDLDRAATATTTPERFYKKIQGQRDFSDVSGGFRGGAWVIRSPSGRIAYNSDVTQPNDWVIIDRDPDVKNITKIISGVYNVYALSAFGNVYKRLGMDDVKTPGGSSWRQLLSGVKDMDDCK